MTNCAMIVPTGIGAEVGGHSGDSTPAAKLLASVCDNLFIHPNIVNASDINEMSENMIYTEGSTLDRFLMGKINLKKVYSNKILLAVNEITPEIVNAASAARATIGADIEIVKLGWPIVMKAFLGDKGNAEGFIYNMDDAIRQIKKYKFDVLVINTPIETRDDDVIEYLSKNGGVNIWGGIEARLSKDMSMALNRPVIHAPVENSEVFKSFNEVVDPRKAAEMVSKCYVHCCLKGAHKAPKIMPIDYSGNWSGFNVTDIDFLISPVNVVGTPHEACISAGIPVIAVEENRTILNDKMPDSFIVVKNYLEAVGVIVARKAGVSLESVRRPLRETKII